LHDPDPSVRVRSCHKLTALRHRAEQRIADALCARLEEEQDSEAREAVGFALMKTDDPRAPALLRAAIDRQEEGAALAKLIGYYATVAGRDAAEDLEQWSQCGRTWYELGAGAGLLAIGDVRGAEVLLHYARLDDPYVRHFAARFLGRVSEPMMDMVGQPCDLSTPTDDGFGPEQLAAVTAFWHGRDRTRELRDYLDWRRHEDPQWHEVQRLLKARVHANRIVADGAD
jgi:HEAT repeat protein